MFMTNLFSIAEDIRRCTKCPLWKARTLAVPGDGPQGAKLMFIGEAPGAEEDRIGLPFVGRSGKFLTEAMERAGIDRKSVFITGSCKCRPPQNRTPTSAELSTCVSNWTSQQISLINPNIVILMGQTAVKGLLGKGSGQVKDLHGKIFVRDGRNFFVTYHPSAAMRFPLVRKMFEKDLKILKNMTVK